MSMTKSRWRWGALALPLLVVWVPAHSADTALVLTMLEGIPPSASAVIFFGR